MLQSNELGDYVNALWNGPIAQRVAIGREQWFPLDDNTNGVFTATTCYGCKIVILASRTGVYIRHFAEVVGGIVAFDDDALFDASVIGPLESAMSAHKADLGSAPTVFIFTPTGMANGARITGPNGIQATIQQPDYFPNPSSIDIAEYTPNAASAIADTYRGKVVVEWNAPNAGCVSEQPRYGRLIFWAQNSAYRTVRFDQNGGIAYNGQCNIM